MERTKEATQSWGFDADGVYTAPPARLSQPNPMVRAFGSGPVGAICKTCEHLNKYYYKKTYYKCSFRKLTHGAVSDHRVSWKACSKHIEGQS